MGYLEQAQKATPQAPILTIVGFPKTGKTTLGGMFPSPVFIQVENASTVFEEWPETHQPTFLPQIPSANKAKGIKPSEILAAQLRELCTAEHTFKTVIIDSITALNTLYEEEVVAYDENPNCHDIGNAAGGFHKGYLVTAGMHAKVIMMAEHIRRKGIAVVFLAHTGITKLKNRPDTGSEYTAFSIDMAEKSKSLYIQKSDAVLYLRSKEVVLGHDSDKKGNTKKWGRVSQSGKRVLVTCSDGTVGFIDAGNRYSMPPELDVPEGSNPILQYIPFFRSMAGAALVQAPGIPIDDTDTTKTEA